MVVDLIVDFNRLLRLTEDNLEERAQVLRAINLCSTQQQKISYALRVTNWIKETRLDYVDARNSH